MDYKRQPIFHLVTVMEFHRAILVCLASHPATPGIKKRGCCIPVKRVSNGYGELSDLIILGNRHVGLHILYEVDHTLLEEDTYSRVLIKDSRPPSI